jgi:hypothetical protein
MKDGGCDAFVVRRNGADRSGARPFGAHLFAPPNNIHSSGSNYFIAPASIGAGPCSELH